MEFRRSKSLVTQVSPAKVTSTQQKRVLLDSSSHKFTKKISINPKRIYGSEVKLQEQKHLKITTFSTPKTLIEIRKQSRRYFHRNPEIDKTVPKSEDFHSYRRR